MKNNPEMDTSGKDHQMGHKNTNQYKNLILMVILSFIAMYILMYSMVDKLTNVIPNINQIYMAGLMTSPMIIIELLIMRGMYKNKKWNAVILGITTVFGVLFYFGIRKQAFVEDRQFLKSMIPHHAAAILMVEQATMTDPEIKHLGEEIILSQQKEIDFMKAKIKSLENK